MVITGVDGLTSGFGGLPLDLRAQALVDDGIDIIVILTLSALF